MLQPMHADIRARMEPALVAKSHALDTERRRECKTAHCARTQCAARAVRLEKGVITKRSGQHLLCLPPRSDDRLCLPKLKPLTAKLSFQRASWDQSNGKRAAAKANSAGDHVADFTRALRLETSLSSPFSLQVCTGSVSCA